MLLLILAFSVIMCKMTYPYVTFTDRGVLGTWEDCGIFFEVAGKKDLCSVSNAIVFIVIIPEDMFEHKIIYIKPLPFPKKRELRHNPLLEKIRAAPVMFIEKQLSASTGQIVKFKKS